jgi:cardiolipin synthase
VLLAALRDPWADVAACVVFSVAAITDYFDGKLARDRQQTSDFGRMLDPIADKLLVGAALMLLAGMGRLTDFGLFPAIVILLREILVSACGNTSRGCRSGCRSRGWPSGRPASRWARSAPCWRATRRRGARPVRPAGLLIGELMLWTAAG